MAVTVRVPPNDNRFRVAVGSDLITCWADPRIRCQRAVHIDKRFPQGWSAARIGDSAGTTGLPREIGLRQKQYEYYRDLLVSFPQQEQVAA